MATGAAPPPEKITATHIELIQLYQIYRLASLNQRYYGYRDSRIGAWNTRLRVIAALGSSGTLLGLLAGVSRTALVLSIVAAVASTISPFLGLIEKTVRFEKLHFAYSELYAEIDALIREIRLRGFADEGHMAVAKAIRENYATLSTLDEPNPDRQVIDRFTKEVNAAIPVESLWLPDYE